VSGNPWQPPETPEKNPKWMGNPGTKWRFSSLGTSSIKWLNIDKMDTSSSGWWLTYPSEKYDFLSWNYYSQYMEK